MADYSALKATIDASINTNGQQAITGAILNDVLNEMVDVLGEGYTFLGVATISTNPTTPEGKAYYLAGAAGTYSNFGNIVVASDEVALLVWNGTAWSKVVSPAASKEEVSELDREVNGKDDSVNVDFTIPTGGVNITKNVNIRAGVYNISVIDPDNVLPQNTTLYLNGSNVGHVKTMSNPYNIANDVSTIQIYSATAVSESGNITIVFADTASTTALSAQITSLRESTLGTLEKTLSWSQGWINTSGRINPSTASIFTQPFKLRAGESVIIGTNNANICIIGTTEAERIAVGDTISVLQTTSLSSAFETYTYTAEADMNIVLCVRESDYTLDFLNKNSLAGEIAGVDAKVQNLSETLNAQNQKIQENENENELNIYGITDLVFNVEQGQPLSPSIHNYPVNITRGSSVYFIPSYPSGMYPDGQVFFIYLQYADGTTSSGIRAVAKSTPVVAVQDVRGIKVYCSTVASADGQLTLSVILDKNANYGNVKYSVPSYYFANSYLLNKLNRIKSLSESCIADGTSFVFTTDEHWERNAGNTIALLRYIYQNINIDKYISGGDSGHLLPNIEFGRDRKEAFQGKVFPTIGNHEYLSAGYTERGKYAPPALYNMAAYAYFMYRDNFVGNVERGYYYFDDAFRKIRHITLAAYKQSAEIEYTISGVTYYRIQAEMDYDEDQLNWLENVALNVDAGWKIIIVTHTITAYNHNDDMLVPVIDNATKPVCEILLRYNGNGTIVGVFAGHTHSDGLTLLNDDFVGMSSDKTGKSIPVIVTTCDAYNFDDVPGEALEGRTLGTITEQAFDIDVIDFANKDIHCVRIGAMADLTYHKSGSLEERIVNYEPQSVAIGSSITLLSGLSDSVTWSSQDSGIASVSSSGVVTGVSEGSVFVSAVDAANHISHTFIVKVTA